MWYHLFILPSAPWGRPDRGFSNTWVLQLRRGRAQIIRTETLLSLLIANLKPQLSEPDNHPLKSFREKGRGCRLLNELILPLKKWLRQSWLLSGSPLHLCLLFLKINFIMFLSGGCQHVYLQGITILGWKEAPSWMPCKTHQRTWWKLSLSLMRQGNLAQRKQSSKMTMSATSLDSPPETEQGPVPTGQRPCGYTFICSLVLNKVP